MEKLVKRKKGEFGNKNPSKSSKYKYIMKFNWDEDALKLMEEDEDFESVEDAKKQIIKAIENSYNGRVKVVG